MAKIVGYYRNVPGGTGVNGVTMSWKKKVDDSVVATDATAADAYGDNGEFSFAVDGSPGPSYITGTSGSETKVRDSRETGYAGTWFPAEHPYYDYAVGDGVMNGIDNSCAVDAPGGMNIRVATGQILNKGHLYRCTAATTVAITAADATHPRIDRVVCRLTRIGETQEGKLELAVVAGTPAASPSAPAATQSSATWEITLATVAVAAGAASITNGNITDAREYCFVYPLTTTGDMLYRDANGKPTRLAVGTSSQVLMGGTVPTWGTVPTSALDAELQAIAGLTSAANKVPYFTGSGTAAVADFTAAGRALVDDADAAAQRTTLGLGSMATQNSSSISVTNATVSNSLVTETLASNSDATLGTSGGNKHTIWGQTTRDGSVPTVTMDAGAGTGASGSFSTSCDEEMRFNFTTGTGTSNGTFCSIFFGQTRLDSAFNVQITPEDSNGADLVYNAGLYAARVSSNEFELKTRNAPTASMSGSLYISVRGRA